MNKLTRLCCWSLLFALIACSNLSNLCRHGNASSLSFRFNNDVLIDGQQNNQQTYSALNQFAYIDNSKNNAQKISWDQLEDVTYQKRWNKEYQLDVLYPVFGNNVKKLKGKQLSISGYMIPLNIEEGLYAISRNNYASCFFCGRSGPESVVSLKFKTKPRRYRTDEYLTMQGTMELNDTNMNDFIYIFRNTEEVK